MREQLLPGVVIYLTMASFLAPAAQARSLSPTERIAAARALEQVEWNHTIWPEDNPRAKPSLDDVLPPDALRRRAEDGILESLALSRYWGRPLTGAALQAEIDRMVRDSKRPDVLRELFAALGNDPFVVAECLARPRLADRLVRAWYARDERFHGALRRSIESRLAASSGPVGLKGLGGAYHEIELLAAERETDESGPGHAVALSPESWRRAVSRLARLYGAESAGDAAAIVAGLPTGRVSPLQEEDDRFAVQSIICREPGRLRVATVIWYKTPFEQWWEEARRELEADGGLTSSGPDAAYALPPVDAPSCTADTWTAIRQSVPDRRYEHTAVWTGAEMIVWGGYNYVFNIDELNTGARYDPATDTWRATSTGANAPTKRMRHTAVWTGAEMIVWGGSYDGGSLLSSGARYNPRTDTWTAIPYNASIPAARDRHTAVWTGAEMIVWGGVGIYGNVNTGAAYAPSTETWLALPTTGAPAARYSHTALWTGSVMIVWGGHTSSDVNTGGRFNPIDGSWSATSTAGSVPTGRQQHSAVWTGSEMIVWGGLSSATVLNTGGRYNPATDSWTATSTGTNVPLARNAHTAVWTGSQMIVWGGINWTYPSYNTGGRYTPSTDSWSATSTTNAPSARDSHTAVWTGSEMIVWGGEDSDMTNTGGRYNPVADTWVPTSTGSDVPSARYWHAAVWTGSRMIVWGGYDDLVEINTGGRYDPATDAWAPTSTGAAVPPIRRNFPAVWTGTEMIVWGGYAGSGPALNSGGRYNPVTDVWTATSTGANVPTGRIDPAAVWTGSEMIVWGGYPTAGLTNTGGRYRPASDTWTATSVGANVPTGRRYHTLVWTGQFMIVWGGETSLSLTKTNTGGRYDPAADTWLPTSVGTNVPGADSRHIAVWTGSQMIVWGYGTPNGGRYDPSSDTWLTVAGAGNPGGRTYPSGVWTGSEMLVWGGGSHVNTGGRYNPATNTWIVTGTAAGVPGGRCYHTGIWTGGDDGRLIVWGGEPVTQTGGAYCGSACTATTFWKDIDGDGYGTTLYTATGCTAPPGYVANSADCADSDPNDFPGNPEVCDGWDNNCNFIIDTDAVTPTGVPSLVAWKYGSVAEVSWSAVPGADRYDVVRGTLSSLRTSGGDYSTATATCNDNVTTRRFGDSTIPAEGDGVWFLLRAENCRGNGTWDEGSPGQSGSRDAEIAASAHACP